MPTICTEVQRYSTILKFGHTYHTEEDADDGTVDQAEPVYAAICQFEVRIPAGCPWFLTKQHIISVRCLDVQSDHDISR